MSIGNNLDVREPADRRVSSLRAQPAGEPVVHGRSTMVSIASLVLDGSPRIEGEDHDHIRTLAEADADLPPILVHQETMRVLDGMHRVRAALYNGRSEIGAVFFSGDERAAFVKAVEANSSHGLPLTLDARRVAARRIVISYPQWSDRAVAASTGLSTTSVRTVRKSLTGPTSQLNARIGRDGKTRPLDASEGRHAAAAYIRENPSTSLREIASHSGISVATARDVRIRLHNGEDPLPTRVRGGRPADTTAAEQTGSAASSRLRVRDRGPGDQAARALLQTLKQDPSLRYSEKGRLLIRWLEAHLVDATDWARLTEGLPPHCAFILADIAAATANTWNSLARQLK